MIFEKWYSWLFGIIAVSLYGFSCYHYKIYGEMFLQAIYVIISMYGLYSWKHFLKKELRISKLEPREWIFYLIVALILCAITFFILQALQGELPILDALTNGFAIVATYLAARKKIDNWLIWIPVNIVTIYMMLNREMPFYAILYLCYGLFAIVGFIQWKKNLVSQNELNGRGA